MTGAFVKIRRGEQVKTIEIEYLTNEERVMFFKDKDEEEILRWLDLVCNSIDELGVDFQEDKPYLNKEEIDSIYSLIEESEEAKIFDSEGEEI